MIFDITDDTYEIEQMWREADARVREIRRREQKALAEKKYNEATQFAWMRIEEQKRRDYLAARIEGVL